MESYELHPPGEESERTVLEPDAVELDVVPADRGRDRRADVLERESLKKPEPGSRRDEGDSRLRRRAVEDRPPELAGVERIEAESEEDYDGGEDEAERSGAHR